MKKYLKIFIVCFTFVALLTVNCFATSEGVYSHYIKPGDYILAEELTFDTSTGFGIEIGSFTCLGTGDREWYLIEFDSGFFEFYYRDIHGMEYVQVANYTGWFDEEYRYITVNEGFYITDPIEYTWWMANVTPNLPYQYGLLDGLLASFVSVGQWISGATSSLTTMFWSNNSLTFLGSLSIGALAFAVAFLIIGFISRFLRFRG